MKTNLIICGDALIEACRLPSKIMHYAGSVCGQPSTVFGDACYDRRHKGLLDFQGDYRNDCGSDGGYRSAQSLFRIGSTYHGPTCRDRHYDQPTHPFGSLDVQYHEDNVVALQDWHDATPVPQHGYVTTQDAEDRVGLYGWVVQAVCQSRHRYYLPHKVLSCEGEGAQTSKAFRGVILACGLLQHAGLNKSIHRSAVRGGGERKVCRTARIVSSLCIIRSHGLVV